MLGELSSWRLGESSLLRLRDHELREKEPSKKNQAKKPLAKLDKLIKLEVLNDERLRFRTGSPAPTFVRASTARGRQMYGLAPRNSRLTDFENEKLNTLGQLAT